MYAKGLFVCAKGLSFRLTQITLSFKFFPPPPPFLSVRITDQPTKRTIFKISGTGCSAIITMPVHSAQHKQSTRGHSAMSPFQRSSRGTWDAPHIVRSVGRPAGHTDRYLYKVQYLKMISTLTVDLLHVLVNV